MKRITGVLGGLFGPSHNDKFAELLKKLSTIGVESARHFRETGGQDLKSTIEFEHRADAIVDEIHELLDNSFIMRFDVPDSMRLTDDIDDVIDGMRKVAIHLDVYRVQLTALTPVARELMELAEQMVKYVDQMVDMLMAPRLELTKVRDVARLVDDAESKADKIVAAAERELVAEFSPAGKPTLGFIAWHQLYHLLEQMTDDANHCAKLILSLARKEA